MAINEPIVSIEPVEGKLAKIKVASGWEASFDAVYAALGEKVRSDLGLSLGARHDKGGCLIVDERQQTSVNGLYAAGDVVIRLNQICVAMGQAAVAATSIHNELRTG